MAASIFPALLKKFRQSSGLSQAEVARLLGVRQATVSRLESGRILPSEDLAEKIKSLSVRPTPQDGPQPEKVRANYALKNQKYGAFTISHVSVSLEEGSGDFCSVDALTTEKLSFALVDTVGHGINASGMSFAMEFGYKTALSILNPFLIQASVLESGIRGAISRTREKWVGPPSLISGTLDIKTGFFEFINSGQPFPYLFQGGEVQELRPSASQNINQISGYWEPQPQSPVLGTLGPGDGVLMFSDGFVGLVPFLNKQQDVRSRFARAAKLLRGDSEAILTNILNVTGGHMEIDPRIFSDDATALLISRKRKN